MRSFRHGALFYRGVGDLVAQLEPQIRGSLASEEAVMAMLPSGHLEPLRTSLGPAARLVRWVDMQGTGGNPARIIPFLSRFVAGRRNGRIDGGGVPVLVVAEPVHIERSDAELVEAQHHETLLDLAFGDVPDFTKICPYDLDALPVAAVDEARRSHALILGRGGDLPSPDYAAPDSARWAAMPLPDPPASAQRRLAFGRGIPSSIVDFVSGQAERLGLSRTRREDLALAVVATARSFCPEGGTLRMWSEEGTVVAEIEGSERTEEPLAGRERSAPRAYPERGLWFANQVCDLLQHRQGRRGSTVRLHMAA